MPDTAASHRASRTAQIRALARRDLAGAEAQLSEFLADTFRIPVSHVRIRQDQYSLNSLNGFFRSSGRNYFFKFHQEEGEEDMQGEYYRADILARENLPVDLPVWSSSSPGEQVLVYNRREDRRFSDVLRDLDEELDDRTVRQAADAERALNQTILDVALRTLHAVDEKQVAAEPIHHLFYERMVDPKTGRAPGGRYRSFYIDQVFSFPGSVLSWKELASAELHLNGQVMASTIGETFDAALTNLNPVNLTGAGGITAHGDAHNANVWYDEGGDAPSLTYFDPAFAGRNIPALLAEIKPTFHNVFAHPLWLYEPELAQHRFGAQSQYKNGVLQIETDWDLSNARIAMLNVKIEAFWKPFLQHLADEGRLPVNWQDTMRSALAMCPARVMNLRAGVGAHNPTSSLIGIFIIGLTGARPKSGQNRITQFFKSIDPRERHA
ncbi:MAG: hypothetical protein AAGJ74_01260 [Pseudomonadota bacterium]